MTQIRGEFPEKEKVALFKHAHQVLNENHVYHWIYYGTLLGHIREQGIISSDADIDLCVYDFDDVMKLLPQLEGTKYRTILKHSDTKYATPLLKLRPIDYKTNFHLDIYKTISSGDFNVHKRTLRLNPFAKLFRKHHFRKMEILFSKRQVLKIPKTGFTTAQFYNETVNIPIDTERHLRFLYGPNWRKKDPNYATKKAGTYGYN